jgi:hypothetical protein
MNQDTKDANTVEAHSSRESDAEYAAESLVIWIWLTLATVVITLLLLSLKSLV